MDMKRCFLSFALLGMLFVSSSFAVSEEEILQEWKKFVVQNKKQYNTLEEHNRRFEIFSQNYRKIMQWNEDNKEKSARLGINKFADMSEEEFRSTILLPTGAESPCDLSSKREDTSLYDISDLPESFDWREKGAVSSVKDQGSVGTCWAFSTTGNIEGQWFLAGNELIDLSNEQLNDCDPYDCGVFGGWPCRAMQYVIGVGGVKSEEQYPYCVGTGECFPCMAPGWNRTFCGPPPWFCNSTKYPCNAKQGDSFAAKISDWKSFTEDETLLAAALMKNGPISALLNAGSGLPPLQFHQWGVYNPYFCDPKALDHAVLIVGFGVEKSIFGETPYWLVKNSWGDGGYFKIARGEGTCGINIGSTSAIV